MDAKHHTFSNTHRSTKCGLKNLDSGFSRKVEKWWQNGGIGGGGNGPKTISPVVTRGDLIKCLLNTSINQYNI